MSLVNRMLHDLDVRGGAVGADVTPGLRPVERRGAPGPIVIGGVIMVAAAAAGAAFLGVRWWMQPPRAAAPIVAAPAVKALPAPVVTPAPIVARAPVVDVPPQPPAVAVDEAPAPPPVQREKREKRDKPAKRTQEASAALAPARAPGIAPDRAQQDYRQLAESHYRRALAQLQEGRSAEAMEILEEALQSHPRHEAARQTLVRLLIENRQPDQAIRQLRIGLGLDPRQPVLAMLLARLQIERGGSGIETLMQTLPHAGNDAEFYALLATALQRQQRHREASDQYRRALDLRPNNGAWLAGLGISLTAEQRNGEALDAFRRALAAPGLPSELHNFVERKIQQLQR